MACRAFLRLKLFDFAFINQVTFREVADSTQFVPDTARTNPGITNYCDTGWGLEPARSKVESYLSLFKRLASFCYFLA